MARIIFFAKAARQDTVGAAASGIRDTTARLLLLGRPHLLEAEPEGAGRGHGIPGVPARMGPVHNVFASRSAGLPLLRCYLFFGVD